MSYRRRPGKWIVSLLVFCWFLPAGLLYAGGKKDTDLSRADELIAQKQYDEAILSLSLYIKKNPDNFEAAHVRLRKIMKVRTEYNSVAIELMDTLVNDPGNSEKVLALTRELENLESPRNPQAQEFLRRTRDLALFTYNRNRLQNILVQGRAQLDAGSYAEALNTYASGLDIYQEDFFQSGYGEEVEGRVRRGIEDLAGIQSQFPPIAGSLVNLTAQMDELEKSNAVPFRIDPVFRQAEPLVSDMIRLQEILYETANYFDAQLARIQEEDNELNDRSFLSFATRLIHGRSGESIQEGMIGVLEGLWNSTVSQMEQSVDSLARNSYRSAEEETRRSNYSQALSAFTLFRSYLDYPLRFIDSETAFRRWSAGAESSGGTGSISFFGREVNSARASDLLAWEIRNRMAASLSAGEELGFRYETLSQAARASAEDSRQEGSDPQAAMSREADIRRSFGALVEDADRLLDGIGEEDDIVDGLQAEYPVELAQIEETRTVLREARDILSGFRDSFSMGEGEAALRYFSIANGELERRVGERRDEFAEADRFFQGITQVREDGSLAVAHYPSEALALVTQMDSRLEADLAVTNETLALYDAEPPGAPAGIRDLRGQAEALRGELTSLRTRGNSIASQARTQIAQAETYRLDGERLYQEARNALSGNNFDVARDRIQRATERYNESLAIQESSSLRQDWDTRVVALGAEIHRIENEIIIRDVRELVNNARTVYFSGNFEQAEELLIRAQNRWRITNVDEDTEVSYWLTVVRGALSLHSGRTIPATAPLFAEMSQLLSDANKSYNEGVRLINGNRRREGIAKFGEARQKTQEVKLIFPVNQEAGMLELRMDQLTDPAAFNESFVRRFNEAVAGTKPNRRSLESFAELQNLAELNPGYPGMQAAIRQAEIDMGYRPPDPDPRAIARSRELTNAAGLIVEANNRLQYEVALEQLNEALSLNPNNTVAMNLKDRVQTELGGRGNIVLDSITEQEYQRAVRELQSGNTLVALAIVQQLLQDPKNRNSTRIQELQRRIQSIL
jgi:tetratricopeptide (TPR) repeat protein